MTLQRVRGRKIVAKLNTNVHYGKTTDNFDWPRAMEIWRPVCRKILVRQSMKRNEQIQDARREKLQGTVDGYCSTPRRDSSSDIFIDDRKFIDVQPF